MTQYDAVWDWMTANGKIRSASQAQAGAGWSFRRGLPWVATSPSRVCWVVLALGHARGEAPETPTAEQARG